MTAIIILNVIFATAVVVGIVSLLSWGIATDRVPRLRRRPAPAFASQSQARAPRAANRPAYARG